MTETDLLPRLCKHRFGKPWRVSNHLLNRAQQLSGILGRPASQEVDIGCAAGGAALPHRILPDEEIFNAGSGKRLEHLQFLVGYHHGLHAGKKEKPWPYQFAY